VGGGLSVIHAKENHGRDAHHSSKDVEDGAGSSSVLVYKPLPKR